MILAVGKLVLSVTKDTYEELGLNGEPSKYCVPKGLRYGEPFFRFSKMSLW